MSSSFVTSAKTRSWERAEDFKRKPEEEEEEYEAKWERAGSPFSFLGVTQ
jgi:hypothetical protein